jgi:hypothetical protein
LGLVALMPVGHLTIEQWAPAVAGYAWRGLVGQRRWATRSHPIAHLKGARLGPPQPRSLEGVELMGLGTELRSPKPAMTLAHMPEDREALDRYLEECQAPDADPEALAS